jgi:predicted nucleic acid-binding protein
MFFASKGRVTAGRAKGWLERLWVLGFSKFHWFDRRTGGAVYDALIAASVRQAGATLFTRDRRATTVYEKMGVAYELVL